MLRQRPSIVINGVTVDSPVGMPVRDEVAMMLGAVAICVGIRYGAISNDMKL
jgi:hypothetical protein